MATTYEVSRFNPAGALLDYWGTVDGDYCALLVGQSVYLPESHKVLAWVNGEPQDAICGAAWLAEWRSGNSTPGLISAAPAAPAAFHFTYHQYPFGRNFSELTGREMEATLRGGESGALADYTIFQINSTTFETLRTFISGGEFLEYYDKHLTPAPVVTPRVDTRKTRQAQYLVCRLGGAGQFLDQLQGTLPDVVAHAAQLCTDFPSYHSIYRALGKLPTWSGAFAGHDGKPVVLVISKQSGAA